ncbi:MAG: serine/threonine-protein kinase [Thermodesulfobacteriota bacterium]|nr:serine/threonine-protein kinase [Thermodesulfobacteriota bacterium]
MSEDEEKIKSALGKKYEIKSLINSGGMGAIYLGIHRALDRPVAIKIIHQELSQDEQLRKRFCQEAKLAASLDHPVIIDVYDFGSKDDFDYIIMPYIEGSTLQDRLKEVGKFGVQECLRLMIKLTDALSYAHKKNVVHRDIKPSNIMIDNHGHLVLTDFGISKDMGDLGLTVPGKVLGSPKYMSPEQIRGLDVDGRSDLYSLGLVFYEMIAGKHPFEGKDATSIYYSQAHEMPPRPDESVPEIPGEVGDIIMKLLEKSPGQRYQKGDQLLKDLEGLGAGSSKDLRMDVDTTLVDVGIGPEGAKTPPAQAVKKVEHLQQRPPGKGKEPAEKAQAIEEKRKMFRWVMPAVGVTLVIVMGIVWVMRSSPTKEAGIAPKDAGSPKSLEEKKRPTLPLTEEGEIGKSEVEAKSLLEPSKAMGARPSFDSVLEAILALGEDTDANFLRLWVDKPAFRIGDPISYRFQSNKDCYLVLLSVTTTGELIQIFPNRFSLDPFVQGKREYTIPGEDMEFELKITGPQGEEEIVALAAEAPFDLLSATFESQPFFQVDKNDQALIAKISNNIYKMGRINMAQKRVSYGIID